jgi:hypothetical protein
VILSNFRLRRPSGLQTRAVHALYQTAGVLLPIFRLFLA